MTGMTRLLGLPALLVAALVASACDAAAVRSSALPHHRPGSDGGGPGGRRGPSEGAAQARQTGCSGTAPEATNAAWEQQVIELVNQRAQGERPAPAEARDVPDGRRAVVREGHGGRRLLRPGPRHLRPGRRPPGQGLRLERPHRHLLLGGERPRREHRGGLLLAAGGGHRLDGQLRPSRQHPERAATGRPASGTRPARRMRAPLGAGLRPAERGLSRRDQRRGREHRRPPRRPLRLRPLERDPHPERQRGLRPLAALHDAPGVEPGRRRRAAHRERRDAQGIDRR